MKAAEHVVCYSPWLYLVNEKTGRHMTTLIVD